jgi:integrase
VRRIADLKPKPARYVEWDGGIPGFGVRVTPRGAKSFVLTYRLRTGRVRWATLGAVRAEPEGGGLSLDTARDLAQRYLGALADGKDPLRSKDLARDAPTVSHVADRFLKEHVARLKRATQRQYVLAIDRHIRPTLGRVAIADVAPADVLRLHHRLRATPFMANRSLAVLHKLMNWAEHHEYRPQHTNPCRGIRKYVERPRRRYLTPGEMRRLGTALRIAERWHAISPVALTAIRLLFLTGARPFEILSLQWTHIDLARGELRLPDSKTGEKTILLNTPALTILQAWPHYASSPYVFPGEGHGARKGKHRVNLADAWAWIRNRARIPDVRLYDLRHSFASVAISGGQTLPMVGALLGHTQAATTLRYAHMMDNPLRTASEATASTIAEAMAPRRPRRLR